MVGSNGACRAIVNSIAPIAGDETSLVVPEKSVVTSEIGIANNDALVGKKFPELLPTPPVKLGFTALLKPSLVVAAFHESMVVLSSLLKIPNTPPVPDA